MGQTLSEPVTTKETSCCQNNQVKVGVSCMQGWRINMEDAHCQLLSLPGDKDAMFFAVFDGHGEDQQTNPKDVKNTRGAKVAQYASNNLYKKIIMQPGYAQNRIAEALKGGFLQLDHDMTQDETMKDELAGTTAISVLIKNKRLYCANVGDSRAVASVRGRADVLSHDHKPGNEAETRRIIAAGGWVEFNRVNGNLALSRALGDFVFKKNDKKGPDEQIVTAYPDVQERALTNDYEFIVLACDGIWDVLTNQEVIDFIRARIAHRMEPETICEELMARCLAPDCQMGGLGCDNMTVCIVCLLHDRAYEDLIRRCSQPSIGGPVPHLSNYNMDLK
ncbi:probable protein phosphatase 2C T23F11.1 isoform X1 [Ruditapes philippinarum]|uniref:probable protein phosphatase 2C T23F11.1 isoform X1 n=1 Tax=Ruditapes philippinarum TaxID=129788 RepID=UPI00295BD6F4|nr:probable protein phosphatase 2C T23F11.1 isoform X1 [Ruditapes philippinarum]